MSDRKARFGYDPTPDASQQEQSRLSARAQRMTARAKMVAAAQQQRLALHQQGVSDLKLPRVASDMSPTDLLAAQQSMTRMGAAPAAPAAPATLPQPVRTTGNAPVDAGGSPIVPRPAGAAPAPMNPADLKLWRESYQGPNPPKAPLPPDYHTDLRDSPEHGTINPIPGQPLRPMPMSGPTNWNYPKEAAPAATAVAAPVPFQSGRVIEQPVVYDPRTDTSATGASLNAARQAAAANPNTTVSTKTPYGTAGVKMVPNWQEALVKQYPALAVENHPLNKEFVDRFTKAGSDPALAPAIAAAVHADSPESAQISPWDAEAGAPAAHNAPPTITVKPGGAPANPPESAVVSPWDAEAGAPALNPAKDSATAAGEYVNRKVGNAARYMGASAAAAGNLGAEGLNSTANFFRAATGNAPVPFTPPFDATYKPVKTPTGATPAPFTPAAPATAPSDVPPTPLGSTSMNEDPTKQFAQNTEDAEFKKKLTTAPPNVFAYT